MYELLDQHLFLEPGCLDEYKNLKDFLYRFEKLPAIKKYFESDSYIKWPLNSRYAKFGGIDTVNHNNKL